MRRLPVYILLDCSESMVGDAINSVQTGLETLLGALRSDPHALETAWISIITFSHRSEQIVPLMELTDVVTPKLSPSPGTALGKALALLKTCIDREVKRSTPNQKADYRPLVFLLTDGQPTDDWRSVKDAIDRLTNPRIANFYAIGCGDDIDFDMLNDVSDVVFKLVDMQPATLKKLFIWLTASVQGASTGVGVSEEYAGIDLSKKPQEVMEVAPGTHRRHTGPPLQVFLKACCSSQREPYLMRFRYQPEYGMYEPIKSHRLEMDAVNSNEFALPEINASQLMGPSPCPWCPNTTVGVCGCGAMMCLPTNPPPSVICPTCQQQITLGPDDGRDFSLKQSAG